MTAKIPPKQTPKAAKDTVYVDVDDEITAIIDKVEAAKEKVVALVLPKRTAVLQSVVNMRLLKRSADSAGKNVVLITSETALLPLAGAAKIHVAKNLQTKPIIPPSPLTDKEVADEAPPAPVADEGEEKIDEKTAKLDYHRSIGELAATGSLDEPESIPLDNADETPSAAAPKPKGKKLKIPDFDRFRLLLGAGILGLVGLIIFIILALFVLPKATITVTTTSTPLSASFSLKALDSAKALDLDKGIIPSALKSSQQTASQQVTATGQQNNGNKATGSVKISNCSDSPITLPAGTGLSANGLAFLTQSSMSLDSGNFTSGHVCKSSGSHVGNVNVAAQAPGTKYNIGASSFTVNCSGCSGVSGASSSSMSGGTDNIVTVVSQQDIDNAKAKLTSQNSDEFSKKFQKDLTDQGYYLFSSTLKLSEPNTTASPNVGQQATTVNVTTQITYSVMVVKRDDLKQAITHELNKQVDTKSQKISSPDVVKDASITVGDQSSPGSGTLTIDENTTAVPIIDVNNLRTQAKGHKKADVQALLSSVQGVKDINVKFSPFWVSKVPKSEGKIKVILHEDKTSSGSGR